MIDSHKTGFRRLDYYTSGHQGRGILQYGSGFSRGFDWSLSSFNTRNIRNALPSNEDARFAFKRAQVGKTRTKAAFKVYNETNEIVIGKMEDDGTVIKRGRTTGLTVGTVNTIPSNIWIQETLELRKNISFEAHAILGPRGPFVRPGDSGAWIFNMSGGWIGSIVGSHDPTHKAACGEVALAIDSEALVADIEAFTGKKVISPERAAY